MKTFNHVKQKILTTQMNLLILVFFAGNMVACSIPDPEKKQNQNSNSSSFYFESFDGEVHSEKLSASEFSLPEAKEYRMSVCLKDKAYNKSIPSHRFRIEELQKEVTTDAKGCLNWTESIKYNFLGKSQYVAVSRTITAKSAQTGQIQLKLLINPWSHGESLSKVYELNRSKIDLYSTRLEDFDLAISRNLWAEKASLFYQNESKETDGTKLTYDFQTSPQIQLEKMNGENVFYDLKQGQFKAELQLIHSTADLGHEKFNLLGSFKPEEPIKMKNGILYLRPSFLVKDKPERGQLFLGVKIIPVGGPQELKTFQGLYNLGEAKNLRISSAMIRLQSQSSQNANFDLERDLKLISTASSPGGESGLRKMGLDLTKFEIKSINQGFESTTEKDVHYKVSTCLFDGENALKSEEIQIISPNIIYDSEKSQKTNQTTGCFEWTEKIHFKRYECQYPIAREVQIVSKKLNFNKTVRFFVNPWETWGRFGFDSRTESPDNESLHRCTGENRPRSLLILTHYNLTKKNIRHQVDKYLNLKVSNEYKLELNAEVRSPGNLFIGRKEHDELTSGFYLLRIGITRNKVYTGDNEIVTIFKKIVPVSQGKVLTDVQFETLDLKALQSKNDIIFELEPVLDSKVDPQSPQDQIRLLNSNEDIESAVDQNSGLVTQPFTSIVILKDDSNSVSLSPLNDSITKNYLFNIYKEEKNKSSLLVQLEKNYKDKMNQLNQSLDQLAQFTELEKQQNLKWLNILSNNNNWARIKSELGADATTALLKQEIESGKISTWFAQKLCHVFINDLLASSLKAFNKNSLYQNCFRLVSQDPNQFFMTGALWKIGNVSSTELVEGRQSSLNINSGFSLRHSFSENSSDSASVNANIGTEKFNIFKIFPVGVNANVSHQTQWTDSRSKDATGGISESMYLDVRRNMLKLTLNQYEKCLIVKINPKQYQEYDELWSQKFLNIFKDNGPLKIQDQLESKISAAEKLKSLSQGLLFCTGEKSQQSVQKIESYFTISQCQSDQSTQDCGDLKNQTFLTTIRGNNDYKRLKGILNSKISIPPSLQQLREEYFTEITKHAQDLIKVNQSQPGFLIIGDEI